MGGNSLGISQEELAGNEKGATEVAPHRGSYRDRTDDIHGVNVALYQLS